MYIIAFVSIGLILTKKRIVQYSILVYQINDAIYDTTLKTVAIINNTRKHIFNLSNIPIAANGIIIGINIQIHHQRYRYC